MPWNDATGRFSWFKLLVFAGLFMPVAWLVLRGVGGDLGGRPVTELLRRTGDWSVWFLLLTLAVSPGRAVWDWPQIVQLRRMLGVASGGYAIAHVMLYVIQQNFSLPFVAGEIARRLYLTIGFVAFCGMVALTITSTDGWRERMRGSWKKLQRLVFPITVLALLHYFMQAKIDITNAVFAAGLFFWLGSWRLLPRRVQARPLLFAVLALAAALATATFESLWYATETGLPALRVLAANLRFTPWPRPAVWIAILYAIVAVIGAVRRWKRRPRREPALV